MWCKERSLSKGLLEDPGRHGGADLSSNRLLKVQPGRGRPGS